MAYYCTLTEARAKLAAINRVTVDNAPEFWDSILGDAISEAYNLIQEKLQFQGYTKAQIDCWDRRREYNLNLALWWAFEFGGIPQPHDTASLVEIKKYLTDLEEGKVTLLVNTELVDPENQTSDDIVRFGCIEKPTRPTRNW